MKHRMFGLAVSTVYAAAFGRLCVETGVSTDRKFTSRAAAFGRLCVETLAICYNAHIRTSSRLRAAVC